MENQSGKDRYTLSGDAVVEGHIARVVSGLTDDLVEAVRPLAVVISGSLGRGEATAYRDNGGVKMVSDIEIGCVDRNWLKRKRLKRLAPALEEKYGVDITLNFFLPRRFTSLAPANWAPFGALLSIEQYELATASRFVYGPDLRGVTSGLSANEIPVWEGIRLLFNRMAEFMEALIVKNGGGREFTREARSVDKACGKLLTASGDAVLLTMGLYHALYSERMERFGKAVGAMSPGHRPLGPEENEAVVRAYTKKLRPEGKGHPNTEALVTEALCISEKVFRHVIGYDLGLNFSSYDEFARGYLAHPRLKRYCRTNTALQNIVSLIRTKARDPRVRFRDFFGPVAVQHSVYAALPSYLYGRFRPLWEKGYLGCIEGERTVAGELTASWKRICE